MRLLYFFGAIAVVGASIGLLFFGSALCDVYQLLQTRITNEKPAEVGNMLPVFLLAALLGIGSLICCAALFQADSRHAYSKSGRCFHILGGLVTSVAGVIGIVGMFQLRVGFFGIAEGTRPSPEQINALISSGNSYTWYVFLWMAVAGVLFTISSLRFMDTPFACFKPTPKGMQFLIIGSVGLFCVGWIFVFLLTLLSDFEIVDLIADRNVSPQPAQIAGYLNGVTTNFLYGLVFMVFAGIGHVFAGVKGPGQGIQLEEPEEDSDKQDDA